jgi:hypothetical protein
MTAITCHGTLVVCATASYRARALVIFATTVSVAC